MMRRRMDPLISEVTADDAQEAASSPVASPLDGGMLHPADDQVPDCGPFHSPRLYRYKSL